MLHLLRGLGVALGLLLAVYVPTFALVAVLRLSIAHSVPFIIFVSASVALMLMFALQTPLRATLADFGLRWSSKRDLAMAFALAVPFAAAVAGVLSRVHEPGPLAGLTLPPILAWLYFGLCAPLQEELIFRGLLQTVLARNLSAAAETSVRASVGAVAGSALLFAIVHFAVGPWTAGAALALGVLAGELRQRSGSVIPAVIVHVVFNVPGLLMASAAR
ncbi:MAG TPA: CPBP family intramembrane glutamic endopeptidase [Candidatus Binatia bacterium]|nr:CPBP family intramembrane glutamic endopeptidase [Candidatus Binatia bacterium]